MGGGSFDTKAYRNFATNVADKPVDHIFTSRAIHPDLDPRNVKVRESCDSSDSPEACPIIAGIDVTGSMGFISDYLAKEGLGTLFRGILERKPVAYPHMMFMGIGDAQCDRAPLQVSQFEADNRIVDQLTKIWLEKGGGSNDSEAYDFPWYFAARHTRHDHMVRRGRRGYLFTVGDEEAPVGLSRANIEKVLGYAPQTDMSAQECLREARRLYNVFHVVIEEGNYARTRPDEVKKSWSELLGQHAIFLSDYKLLAETIVSAIQVAEGTDHLKAASGWGSAAASSIVGKAVSNLPRGAVAPRQLGR